MNEIISETNDHNVVAFNGQTLFFANGDNIFLFNILFWVAGFFILAMLGNFFQSLLEKNNIFSKKIQMYAPYIFIFVLLLGSYIFIQKKIFEPQINTPLEQRKNLVTIELPEKKVTVKEDNTVTDQYVFSKDDSFYLSTLHGNKSTSYSLQILHNGRFKEVVYTDHFDEITPVEIFLIQHGFPIKYSR